MSDIMARITEILQASGNTGWEWLAYRALALGILFTVGFRVTQLRRFPTMIRLISTGGTMGKDGEGISSFQALSMALASRVVVAAIASVATSIAAGVTGASLCMD